MAVYTATNGAVKTRRGRPDADDANPWDFFNNQGYRVAGNMTAQGFDLKSVMDLNGIEDRKRADLAEVLRAEEKELRRAQAAFAAVAGHCRELAGAVSASKRHDSEPLRLALMRLGQHLAGVAEYNRQQQVLLAHVDVLDALQGLSNAEQDQADALQRARALCEDTRRAGIDIIQASEPVRARRNGHNTGEAA